MTFKQSFLLWLLNNHFLVLYALFVAILVVDLARESEMTVITIENFGCIISTKSLNTYTQYSKWLVDTTHNTVKVAVNGNASPNAMQFLEVWPLQIPEC